MFSTPKEISMLLFSVCIGPSPKTSWGPSIRIVPIMISLSLKIFLFFFPQKILLQSYLLPELQMKNHCLLPVRQNRRPKKKKKVSFIVFLCKLPVFLLWKLEFSPFSRTHLKVSVIFCKFGLEFSGPFKFSYQVFIGTISGKSSSAI